MLSSSRLPALDCIRAERERPQRTRIWLSKEVTDSSRASKRLQSLLFRSILRIQEPGSTSNAHARASARRVAERRQALGS